MTREEFLKCCDDLAGDTHFVNDLDSLLSTVRKEALEEAARAVLRIGTAGYLASDGTIHRLYDRFGLYPAVAKEIRSLANKEGGK